VKARTIRTDRARKSFLDVFSESCNVSEACRAAGIGRTAAYDWRNDDETFRKAWDEAEQTAIDKLEKVAWDRATDNSDRMLEILLKAHRAEKYVEKVRNEHSGPGGTAMRHEIVLNMVKTDAPTDPDRPA